MCVLDKYNRDDTKPAVSNCFKFLRLVEIFVTPKI